MVEQDQLVVDLRNNHLATQNLEKQFQQFASAQTSRPHRGFLENIDPNWKQLNVVGTHNGFQSEELDPKK